LGTGSGKTLTFWIPLLFEKNSITILVRALNILEQQTAQRLNFAGVPALNMTRENATKHTFEVILVRYYFLLI
jgi:superfamily II DNA helicase RecQ